MLKGFSVQQGINSPPMYLRVGCQLRDSCPTGSELKSYFEDAFGSKPKAILMFSVGTLFLVGVQHVIQMSTEKEMCRVDAVPNVTFMENLHPNGDVAAHKLEGETVRKVTNVIKTHLPIPIVPN